MGKKFLELSIKRIARTNQAEFIIEKVIKRKGDKLCVKWKGYDSSSGGLIKKILLYKMSYVPEPNICSKNKIEVELDLSNYAAKADLASLKSSIDKLDIDK